MNQEFEDRVNSFRNMINDFNAGTIENKDVIKKEIQAINKIKNSSYQLYFYTYQTDNKLVSRVCGLNLHSELFLRGLEELIINVHNYQITYTTFGPVVSLNDDIVFGGKELSLSKYIDVVVNKNDINCAYAAASYLNSYAIDNKIVDIYFMHKRVVGFYIDIKDIKLEKKGK